MSWIDQQADLEAKRHAVQQAQHAWILLKHARITAEWSFVWGMVVEAVRGGLDRYNATCANRAVPPLSVEASTTEQIRLRRDAGPNGISTVEAVATVSGITVTCSPRSTVTLWRFDMTEEERVGVRGGPQICDPEETADLLFQLLF